LKVVVLMLYTRVKEAMRRIKKAIFVITLTYVMIGAALYLLQEKLIFQPTTLSQDYQYEFANTFEEVFIDTNDNAIINALHFTTKNPKGVVLYYHGNAGDLSRWGDIVQFFVEKQYDVLVMDYRTYGKSTGKLSEQALYNDAQLCYDYLLKTYNEEAITIYGRSLGTGIATYVASINKPNQLILETPYYSLVEVAKNRFPIFPVETLMVYKIPSYQFVKKIDCPITIFHGTSDLVVPYESGKKLFDSIQNEQKQFISIPNGSHNNLIEFEAYHQAINSILK